MINYVDVCLSLKQMPTMTAKTPSEDILSGIMLMHAVLRLLKLDTFTYGQ